MGLPGFAGTGGSTEATGEAVLGATTGSTLEGDGSGDGFDSGQRLRDGPEAGSGASRSGLRRGGSRRGRRRAPEQKARSGESPEHDDDAADPAGAGSPSASLRRMLSVQAAAMRAYAARTRTGRCRVLRFASSELEEDLLDAGRAFDVRCDCGRNRRLRERGGEIGHRQETPVGTLRERQLDDGFESLRNASRDGRNGMEEVPRGNAFAGGSRDGQLPATNGLLLPGQTRTR